MHDNVPHACGFRQRHGCTRNCFGERCQARFERRNVWKTGSEFDSLVCAGLLRPALRVKLFDQTRVARSIRNCILYELRCRHSYSSDWFCSTSSGAVGIGSEPESRARNPASSLSSTAILSTMTDQRLNAIPDEKDM